MGEGLKRAAKAAKATQTRKPAPRAEIQRLTGELEAANRQVEILQGLNKSAGSNLRAANERIADLANQIDWKSKAKILTESEAEGIAAQRREFEALNEQQNEIAKFLRLHYAAEIGRGEHAGLSLSTVIARYLSRERQATAKAAGSQ